MSDRKGMSWFEKKRAASIRPTAWRGGATTSASVAIEGSRPPPSEGREGRPPESGQKVQAPPPLSLDAEARRAAEEALAVAYGELEQARFAIEEAQAEATALRAELVQAQDSLSQFAETALHGAERELVTLAVAVARRVINAELETSPKVIIGWARHAIAASRFGKRLVVALAPDVAARLEAPAWGDLQDAVITDPTLNAGTVELRDDDRTITVSAEERTNLVAAELAAVTESAA